MRKVTLPLICVFLTLMLCSCSGMKRTPNKKTILADYISQNVHLSYAKFDKINILREQLNKNEKRFIADIELTGKDDYAEYTCTASVEYNYYDDRGWMLDKCSNKEVAYQCFQGMTKNEISKYDLDDFVETPTAIYNSNEFDKNNNMHYFYFNTRDGKYRVKEYLETVIFEYKNGNWEYDSTESVLVNTYLDIEGTTWTATPQKGWVDYFNIGPDIYIQTVSGLEEITFKYGEETVEATLTNDNIGYVYTVTNTNTINKIYLKDIYTDEPEILVYPTSKAYSSTDWIEYDLKE